jgi:hypothetical protein
MSLQALRARSLVLVVALAVAFGAFGGGVEAAPKCTNPGGHTLQGPATEKNPHCVRGR